MSDARVVLVIGCSSGFGRASGITFAANGHEVAATARDLSRLTSLLREAEDLPGSVIGLEMDVTVAEDRSRAVDQVAERFGRIDALVNNAGIAQFGPLEATSPDVLRLIVETDFFGPAELMRLVLPIMRAQSHGRIVNVTSGAAHGTSAHLSAYGSAKHALDVLTAAVDLEVMPFGIRAVSVVPGTFMTGIADNVLTAPEIEPYGDQHLQLVQMLLGHFGRRTDLAVVASAIVEAATAANPEFIALAGSELAASVGQLSTANGGSTNHFNRLAAATRSNASAAALPRASTSSHQLALR